jgi:phenylalanyl-tRNA synthetase beta chain
MLCSGPELELGGDAGSILVLPDHAEPGAPLAATLGIEADVLYDLEINPNRPDAMSVAGVARDLAAWYRLPFELPSPSPATGGDSATADASVEILAPDLCGRFTASVLRGVHIGPSPALVANRLTLVGMRPINNVVDASNYVMLELGQSSHPYDLATLPRGAIRVRRARPGETLVTLDDVERRFTEDDLLICNGDDEAIGVAGIMGGASTEISDATRDVLLEMAWFQPMAIASSSRRLGLRSEASARFEKGQDPWIIELAAARYVELLGTAAGTLAPEPIDVRGELPEPARVRVRTVRTNSILGTELDGEAIRGYLAPIGFETAAAADDGDDSDVVAPTFRPDVTTEIDVIEEVGRHHGYPKLTPALPPSTHVGSLTALQSDRRAVRRAMVGLGYAEAMPMPFLAPGDLARADLPDEGIVITNPLVAEESVLRPSLLPGLLKAIAFNESHRNLGVGLFEVGHVFRSPSTAAPTELPDEREQLGVALAGREAAAAVEALAGVLDALGFTDHSLAWTSDVPGTHPTRTARVVVDGEDVGVVGEVDPVVAGAFGVSERVAWLELDLAQLLAIEHGDRPYRPVSRFPSSDIDLAFEVKEATPAGDVARTLRTAAGDLLTELELFDVYRGPGVADGARSLAYRLRFQAPDRTLTDAEVAALRQRCIDAVRESLPATLRGQ